MHISAFHIAILLHIFFRKIKSTATVTGLTSVIFLISAQRRLATVHCTERQRFPAAAARLVAICSAASAQCSTFQRNFAKFADFAPLQNLKISEIIIYYINKGVLKKATTFAERI